ncbi:MAG: site-specific DNA-methyltransferase [Rhodospirillaceae bacterium]|nr:site-specific DNA-methyltransferase [Rhodospirillaceae bacterium]
MQVTYCRGAELKRRSRNPRTHSKKQIRQLADSILTFGWTNPILIDADSRIVAGHGRLEAAKLLGIERVPTIRLDHLSEEQIRAYVIADNRLAEIADWDRELLALELGELATLNLDFELTVVGFDTPELDILIGDGVGEAPDEADEVPVPDPDAPVISRLGDLWQIGGHRLLCGDATDPAGYKRLLGDRPAQIVIVDPPYNVPIAGHVSGLGCAKHQNFAMASGELTSSEFITFLQTALALHAAHSQDGAIHYVFMDWRHIGDLLTAGDTAYSELKNICVWAKTNAGMGSLYRSAHELIAVFKVGTGRHINNIELGRHGRNRTNVWTYAGYNTFGPGRDEALAAHPTVKPIALIADAIKDCSHRGGVILDGFAGFGTTLLAAERTGRIGCGIELDPRYVDATIRRLAQHADLEAVHAGTGQTFAEVEAARATESVPAEIDAATSSDEEA